MGGRAVAVAGDVALPETAERLVAAALKDFGSLDISVSCAGINQDGMLHKMSDEQWGRVLAVNLNGAFYLTRRAAQEMRRRGWGRIINIGSIAWTGNLGQANYAASKAGVVALTKTAARELGRYGVTCNVISPGFVETDMTAVVPEEARRAMISRIPAQRVGTPGDVGETVAFLSTEAAGYINGQVLDVGGGLVL